MPKILHILNRPHYGGPILYASSLIKGINRDYESRLIVGELQPNEEDASHILLKQGIRPMILKGMVRNISPFSDFLVYRRLRRIIRTYKPDIVHSNGAKAGAIGRLAAHHEGVKVIVHTFHGYVFHSYFSKIVSWVFLIIERYLASFSSKIIAISPQQNEDLSVKYHVAPSTKILTIPLGFDFSRFINDQKLKRDRFRQEFGISDEEICIGIVGRMVPVKNHDFFIRAIAKILKNTSVKIRAFIVGDGETRAAMEELAANLGIQFTNEFDRKHPHPMIFTSWREDIDSVYAGLDIITLCSKNEGTPVTLMEAQAASKPIVATKVGGIPDTVIEGRTALLSNPGEFDSYCDNLKILAESPELRSQLSSESKTFVLENFHFGKFVAETEKLYSTLLSKKV